MPVVVLGNLTMNSGSLMASSSHVLTVLGNLEVRDAGIQCNGLLVGGRLFSKGDIKAQDFIYTIYGPIEARYITTYADIRCGSWLHALAVNCTGTLACQDEVLIEKWLKVGEDLIGSIVACGENIEVQDEIDILYTIAAGFLVKEWNNESLRTISCSKVVNGKIILGELITNGIED